MLDMERYIASCCEPGGSLERPLLELVKIRISQINGCAFCLDMHTKEARADSETEQRLYGLSAWRDTPYYTEKERVALGWAEANTLAAQQDVSDELYQQIREHFSEKALMDLTLAIVQINSWNRIAKSFKPAVGAYQAGSLKL